MECKPNNATRPLIRFGSRLPFALYVELEKRVKEFMVRGTQSVTFIYSKLLLLLLVWWWWLCCVVVLAVCGWNGSSVIEYMLYVQVNTKMNVI